ncbi:MAG: hypothetical protein OQK78_12960 [Gammaproteobacteria bacterium]|nr:hypothetical protein [Gammaproteobacteria bacterium]MCW8888760.1 hypothetical protein [Gammaproteobacteria bacterium]MCW8983034.1 hypothetical protein [Gammaproteobacteria bacterium]
MANHISRLLTVAAIGTGLVLSGCAANSTTDTMSATAMQLNNDDFYEVHHEGRIYIFDDAKTYKSYLDVGETAFRKVYIGEGPKGETLVFGLTKADKKKSSGIASIDMYHGKMAGAEKFYGEMMVEGRIYVFSTWKDLTAFKQVGEAPYRFTDIGAGPEGKTVVYVLNKANKKKRPDSLISQFKNMHNMM